jgi:DNA-binding IclR family transcriptional regulator
VTASEPRTSAAKALALMDAFAGQRAILGVTELAERTGLHATDY